jgi:MoaA/NifB/PqqE/SkfB family radical SAM enzyme
VDFPDIDWVHIELTNACNFDCDFCPIKVSKRKPSSMRIDTFKSVVDNIVENNLAKKIQLHVLGEPLLYKNLYPAIEYASNNGLHVMLTTNGSLLDEYNVTRLAKSGIYSLDLSLQVYDSNAHGIRNTSMSFEDYKQRTLKAIATLHNAAGMRITIKLMNTKYKKLFSFRDNIELDQKGKEFKKLAIQLIADVYRELGVDMREKDIAERLERVNLDASKRIQLSERLFLFVQLFMDWGNAFCEKKVHPAKYGKCSFAFTSPSILCDGTVTICCGDFDGGARIGDIHNQPLDQILHGAAAQRLWEGFKRNRLLHPYCQRCLGATNPALALVKGVGSILVSKFLSLDGGKDVVLR